MPLYDFQCDECGHRDERLVHRSQVTLTCPDCGAPMRRLFPCRVAFLNSAQSFHRQARAWGETVGQMFRKDPQGLAELKREAASMGISISDDDTYHRCLANRGGRPDPEAVVPHDDPRAYIEEVARRRGCAVGGMVEVEAVQRDPEPDTGPPIAEDIIQNIMQQRAEEDPALVSTPAKTKKLREDVINRHAPPPACCGDKLPDIGDLL